MTKVKVVTTSVIPNEKIHLNFISGDIVERPFFKSHSKLSIYENLALPRDEVLQIFQQVQ